MFEMSLRRHSNDPCCRRYDSFTWHSIHTRTTERPAFWQYPQPLHDYQYYQFILDAKSKEDKVKVTSLKNLSKLQLLEFWNKLYMQHTFWCCLIRCANMKWIKKYCWRYRADTILSTDGWTEGQTNRRIDGQTRWNQYSPLSTSLKCVCVCVCGGGGYTNVNLGDVKFCPNSQCPLQNSNHYFQATIHQMQSKHHGMLKLFLAFNI